MIAEQIEEQRQQDALAADIAKDAATLAALQGKPLSANQRAHADTTEIAAAERRMKENSRVRDGEEAASRIEATSRELANARLVYQAEIQKLASEHNPKIARILSELQQLQQRKAMGDRSLTWLIESSPAHVAEPLAFLRQCVLREQQGLDRNSAALSNAKARLKAARAGELEMPTVMSESNGWANRDGDARARRDRNRQYSRRMLQQLQEEVDHLQPIFDACNQSVQVLRSKISRLEALSTEAWPTRAAVAEILGRPWDPRQAPKSPRGMYINPLLGTPAEARA